MTEQDERLARAWLALVGWRKGIVDTDGRVFDGVSPGLWSRHHIPALDSPANWGHWLAWTEDEYPVSSGVPASPECPSELMTWVCSMMEFASLEYSQHPAVLDWWKREQEANS